MKEKIKGSWVALITPFFEGQFDKTSTLNLLEYINASVGGVVLCASTGEGAKMTAEIWQEVVAFVANNTQKPIIVGVFAQEREEIVRRSSIAKDLGCSAILVSPQGATEEEKVLFAKQLAGAVSLPILLYNTPENNLKSLKSYQELSVEPEILGIKDSSGNIDVFQKARELRLELSFLQGMENSLLESSGCDGFVLSLANFESKLCKEMFEYPSEELNQKILSFCDTYNLLSPDWVTHIKQELQSRGIIKSSELI